MGEGSAVEIGRTAEESSRCTLHICDSMPLAYCCICVPSAPAIGGSMGKWFIQLLLIFLQLCLPLPHRRLPRVYHFIASGIMFSCLIPSCKRCAVSCFARFR